LRIDSERISTRCGAFATLLSGRADAGLSACRALPCSVTFAVRLARQAMTLLLPQPLLNQGRAPCSGCALVPLLRLPVVHISRRLKRPRIPRPAHRANLCRCSIATLIGCIRNSASHHFVRPPPADPRTPPAGAVQDVLIRGSNHRRAEVRTIAVRAERNEISREAFRTLHAVANP